MANPEPPARQRRTGPLITVGVVLALLFSLVYATCRTWAQSPPRVSAASVPRVDGGS
ncbi:MAG: hypothetical protein ACREMH_10390 [Gemmatimonadales bacterium]